MTLIYFVAVVVLEYVPIPRHHGYPQKVCNKPSDNLKGYSHHFLLIYCNNKITGMHLCNEFNNNMHLASVITNTVFICIFKVHIIGQLVHIIV